MWIIPNNFRACPSARDTAASRLDSNEQAFACAQSLMWRGKHSPQRTWSQRLKREKWLRLLSGRMLRPSLTQTFTAEWASCLPATHANRSARPAKEKEKQTSATCGHSLQGELPLASPDLCSAKMSRDTLPLGLKTFSATWGQWVTATRQDYLARLKSEQATRERESSYLGNWPTPGASQAHINGQGRSTVEEVSRQKTFHLKHRTNKSGEVVVREKGRTHQATLASAVVGAQNWTTPAAHEPRLGYQNRNNGKKGSQKSLTTVVIDAGQPVQGNPSTDGKNPERWANVKLNPNWVEQLMGVPVGWTQLPTEWTGCDSLATESCRKQQQRHSQRYGND